MATKIKQLVEDWSPVLVKEGYAPLNIRKQRILAQLLENSKPFLIESKKILQSENLLTEEQPTNVMGTSSSTAGAGNIDTFDPILISLIRRTMPNLIAYDLCGVQPMSGPTGLIFALRTRYNNMTGTENFYNEVNTGFSTYAGANSTSNVAGVTYAGNTTASPLLPGGANGNLSGLPGWSNNAGNSVYNYAQAMSTAFGEDLGYNNSVIPEMGISIEKTTVTAGERALKAEYSI